MSGLGEHCIGNIFFTLFIRSLHAGVRENGFEARVLVRGVQEVPGLVAAEHGEGLQ